MWSLLQKPVIEGEELPIDKSRVVLGGFSAGGNLAFSAAQIPARKDEIYGIVSVFVHRLFP
jgi:acetyl esterase/lipase